MSAIGTRFDLVGQHTIVRGLPWSFDFTWYQGKNRTPVNLTGCSMRLVIGDTPAADASAEFASPGAITLGGIAGTVAIYLSAANTAGLNYTRPSYWLFITDSLARERVLIFGRLPIKDIE